MTNKTLAYLIIAVLVVASVGFAIWRRSVNKQAVGLLEKNRQENSLSTAGQEAPNPAPEEAPVKDMQNTCERKFDAEKLKTAEVKIKDRQAEINVKGFGQIRLEFFDKDAPKTVENFLRLANSGYFDCLTFHRVAKGFVIQGGDPTGTGSGGQSAFGGEFADEIDPSSALYKNGYKKGMLAMANRGPNTNTSQFFILLDDAGLPPAYTIFGKVISGQEAVDRIGQVEISPGLGPTDGSPKQPVVMEKVTIIK